MTSTGSRATYFQVSIEGFAAERIALQAYRKLRDSHNANCDAGERCRCMYPALVDLFIDQLEEEIYGEGFSE